MFYIYMAWLRSRVSHTVVFVSRGTGKTIEIKYLFTTYVQYSSQSCSTSIQHNTTICLVKWQTATAAAVYNPLVILILKQYECKHFTSE